MGGEKGEEEGPREEGEPGEKGEGAVVVAEGWRWWRRREEEVVVVVEGWRWWRRREEVVVLVAVVVGGLKTQR